MGVRLGVVGFQVVHFKVTHSRDQKTLFLAHGVQWYGRLGRHPRTHMIFLALCSFLLRGPSGLSLTLQSGWFMVQRSDFSLAKIQGASGLALDPCVLEVALAQYFG